MKKVDQLPTGPEWRCELITIKGDKVNDDGKPLEERVELWLCDPVECMREIIGNPAFDGNMAYTPERVYVKSECMMRCGQVTSARHGFVNPRGYPGMGGAGTGMGGLGGTRRKPTPKGAGLAGF